MKLSTYLIFFISLLVQPRHGFSAESVTAGQQKEYIFTLENKIRATKSMLSSKIYGAVYEKLGTSSWKQVHAPFSVDFNNAFALTLSALKKYVYVIAASELMINKEIISDEEKKALGAKDINGTMHKTITSLDFSSKNPLEIGVISIKNDYVLPLFIARYIFDPLKKDLKAELASAIQRCESKHSLNLVVPVGYKGSDVLLIAARTHDALTASLDITKSGLLISRTSFENLKKDIKSNTYDASRLFAPNTLEIVNDTSRDWTVAIYGKKDTGLQLLCEPQFCQAGKKKLYNKNFFMPVSEYDYSSLLWLIFDENNKKIEPTITLNHTMHGGSVARDTKIVHLSKWFVEPKKDFLEAAKVVDLEGSVNNQDEQEDAQIAADAAQDQDSNSSFQKESAVQSSIAGAFSLSLNNVTSKDIFAAVYTQEKEQHIRREKPVKVPLESAVEIGFEQKEQLAFSVSHLELKESLSSFEWDSLNSIMPQEYKDKEYKIQESSFKKEGSFDLTEITLKNDSYSDFAVGRYEYKKELNGGALKLCGVVQSVAKKNFDIQAAEPAKDDADAARTPNFALPQGFKGFIGYKNASDEKSFSSDLPTRIDTIHEFEMTHLGMIDCSDATVFDIESVLTGESLITVQNDLAKGDRWVGLYDLNDRIIRRSLHIAPNKTEKFIPYLERMKFVVKERSFDESMALQPPYGEIFINTAERLSYRLTEAEIVTADADRARNKQKEQALKIAALLKQKQREGQRQQDAKIGLPQNKKSKKNKDKELQEQKAAATTFSKWKKPSAKKSAQRFTQAAKGGKCAANQVRINNNSAESIIIRFYYRGFFSMTPVPKEALYSIPKNQEVCLDLPESGYLSSRYIVAEKRDSDFKEGYSNKEIAVLVKNNRAFDVEKEKVIAVKDIIPIKK